MGVFDTNPIPSNPNSFFINVPYDGDVYGSIHTHPLKAIAMFSWTDMHSLYKMYEKSAAHNGKDVTIILLAKTNDANGNLINNTYALTINNPALFLDKMDKELNAMSGTLKEKLKEKDESVKAKYDFIGRGSANWEKGFLNYFKDYNISLMKANPTFTGWNELKLNDSSLPYDKQTITPNPC